MASHKSSSAAGDGKGMLEGCRIAIIGSPGRYGESTLCEWIEDAGGEVVAKVGADPPATHVLVVEKPTMCDEIETAQAMGIPLLPCRWLKVSMEEGKLEDIKHYPITVSGTRAEPKKKKAASTSAKKRSGSSKRNAIEISSSDGDDDDDDYAPSKAAGKKTKKKVMTDKSAPSDKSRNAKTRTSAPAASKSGNEITKAESSTMRQSRRLPPVDTMSKFTSTHRVLQHQGVVYDSMANFVNLQWGRNNNKFYAQQALAPLPTGKDKNYYLWTKWGRVGERGDFKFFPHPTVDEVITAFNSKFRSKTGLAWAARYDTPKEGKYTFLRGGIEEDDYSEEEEVEDEERGSKGAGGAHRKKYETKLHNSVYDLGELIFSRKLFDVALEDMGYDSEQMPLGKLTSTSIERAYTALSQLSRIIAAGGSNHDLDHWGAKYYTVIPHAHPRESRLPRIDSQEDIEHETQLVDTLRHMTVGMSILEKKPSSKEVNNIDQAFANLKLKTIAPLDKDSDEFKRLEKYCLQKGWSHHIEYSVAEIFRIEREGEEERFAEWKKLQPDNRQLLWHGSRTANFAGILSQGLRIAPPEAPVSGYMFGKGVYLADIATKSINYCHSYLSDRTGLVLLCEAQLGEPLLRKGSDGNAAAKVSARGKHSTYGKGSTRYNDTSDWVDCAEHLGRQELRGVKMPAGTPVEHDEPDLDLLYDELIIYSESQCRFRYLFRLNVLDEKDY